MECCEGNCYCDCLCFDPELIALSSSLAKMLTIMIMLLIQIYLVSYEHCIICQIERQNKRHTSFIKINCLYNIATNYFIEIRKLLINVASA